MKPPLTSSTPSTCSDIHHIVCVIPVLYLFIYLAAAAALHETSKMAASWENVTNGTCQGRVMHGARLP